MAKRLCGHLGGCPRIHYAAGYCQPHWLRWRRNGDPGPAAIGTGSFLKPCQGPECTRDAESKGLCGTHYAQQQRGKPLTPIREQNGPTPAAILRRNLRYGITHEQYVALLEQQGGVCAICKTANPSGRDLAVDHDHGCCPGKRVCGRCVRALLCGRCNIGIGQFLDNPELMRAAAAYIEGWRNG